jgi:membrane protease YdiL (CAAX protease family)
MVDANGLARQARIERVATPLIIVAGCVALAFRPSTPSGLLAIVAAGIAGILWPVRVTAATSTGSPAASPMNRWIVVVAIGVGAFAVARVLATPVHAPATVAAAAATAVAAVSEEAFFRRLVYGWLAWWGPALAVAGAAILFALVHIPGYGARVVPLNLAAALLLGWQRWATGGWSAPAITHAAANLLQMG